MDTTELDAILEEAARSHAVTLRIPQRLWGRVVADRLDHFAPRLTALTTLDLSCAFQDFDSCSIGEEVAKALTGAAPHWTALTHLDLSNNGIGDEGAKALAGAAPHWTALTRLDLVMNNISDVGANALAEAAPHWRNLTDLDLSFNNISKRGAQALGGAAPHWTALTCLGLISNDIGDVGATALADAAPHWRRLTELWLGGNRITDLGAIALADAAPHWTALTYLDLKANEIGKEGAKALADAALHWTALTYLDLGIFGQELNFDLGIEKIDEKWVQSAVRIQREAQALSISFRDSPLTTWRKRNLPAVTWRTGRDHYGFGEVGAKALADAAPHWRTLTWLHLSGNLIKDLGAMALADAARHWTALTQLDLRCNEIGDEGAKALAEASPHWRSLTDLYLDENQITDLGAKALLGALRREPWRSTVIRFRLTGNPLPSVPHQLLRGDSAALWRVYDQEVAAWDETALAEIKVLIVGEGATGKTHIRERIFRGTPLYYVELHESTQDIDFVEDTINARICERGDVVPVRLRVWDFGGQPELHATHRFFLSDQRALFLIAADASRPLADSHLPYWLRMIRAECSSSLGDAPVIIIITKCDIQFPKFSKADVEHLLSSLGEELVPVEDGLGHSAASLAPLLAQHGVRALADREEQQTTVVANIRRLVADLVQSVPGIAQLLPNRFLSFRETINDILRPSHNSPQQMCHWIEAEDFDRMYADSGLSPELRDLLLSILQSLGDFHRVPTNSGLAGAAVERLFNPEWIKGPVYTLIRAADSDHRGGIIRADRIGPMLKAAHAVTAYALPLWKRLPFADVHISATLGLMEAFELAVRVGPERAVQRDILIPDLLPRASCSTTPRKGSTPKQLKYRFLRPSTFLRLLGRHYSRIKESADRSGDKLCWRDEAVFSYGGATILIRPDFDDSAITLHAWDDPGKAGEAAARAIEAAVEWLREIQQDDTVDEADLLNTHDLSDEKTIVQFIYFLSDHRKLIKLKAGLNAAVRFLSSHHEDNPALVLEECFGEGPTARLEREKLVKALNLEKETLPRYIADIKKAVSAINNEFKPNPRMTPMRLVGAWMLKDSL